jgi:hypothetical protein
MKMRFGTVIFMAEVSVSPPVARSGGRRTPLRLFFPEMGWNGKVSPFGRSQTPQNGVCASPRMISLSLGERVGRDGAFTSRRGPGEGLLLFISH